MCELPKSNFIKISMWLSSVAFSRTQLPAEFPIHIHMHIHVLCGILLAASAATAARWACYLIRLHFPSFRTMSKGWTEQQDMNKPNETIRGKATQRNGGNILQVSFLARTEKFCVSTWSFSHAQHKMKLKTVHPTSLCPSLCPFACPSVRCVLSAAVLSS